MINDISRVLPKEFWRTRSKCDEDNLHKKTYRLLADIPLLSDMLVYLCFFLGGGGAGWYIFIFDDPSKLNINNIRCLYFHLQIDF